MFLYRSTKEKRKFFLRCPRPKNGAFYVNYCHNYLIISLNVVIEILISIGNRAKVLIMTGVFPIYSLTTSSILVIPQNCGPKLGLIRKLRHKKMTFSTPFSQKIVPDIFFVNECQKTFDDPPLLEHDLICRRIFSET